MTTAVLQFIVQALTLVFGVLAAQVARQQGRMPAVHRTAWTIVAVFFIWRGIPGVAQCLAAFWALLAGEGSRPYEQFLKWGPAMNHTRTLVSVAMGWVLAALSTLRGQPLRRISVWASVLCCLLAGMGAYAGWQEGATSPLHLTSLSVLGTVELVGILVALLVGMFAFTLDRYLWIILCIYAVHVALNVVWYSASAGFFYPDSWYPPLKVRHLYSAAAYLCGCSLAWHRLVLARRGIPVSDVFGGVSGDAAPAFRSWG